MSAGRYSRRQFLAHTAALAADATVAPLAAPPARRTATDPVPLGSTDLKLSRLGMGTGSRGGRVPFELGPPAFNRLVRAAFERGIAHFDCARSCRARPWLGAAIAPLPARRFSC